PALERAGARHAHVLVFHPEGQTALIAEASTRGDRLSWDAVMELRTHARGGLRGEGAVRVVEVRRPDRAFWAALTRSLREFEVTEPEAVAQILRIEREVLLPAGRRWFAVEGQGTYPALGSLTVLEGVGFVDHVVTLPEARRQGFATAIVRRIVAEARAAGASDVLLLAEPGGGAQRLYERLGFATTTQLAGTLRPLDPRPRVERPPVC
ncbi:MAG: GNAT family N-acetyltransferase, partial [Candidatus Velamenicoccus archaeovorus]